MISAFITSTPEAERVLRSHARNARKILLDSLVLAERANAGVRIAPDAKAADVVIFVEWYGDEPNGIDVQRVFHTSEYANDARKVVVYSAKDHPSPLLPGLYPNLDDRWARWIGCQGAPYLHELNPFLEADVQWDGQITCLASFMGDCRRQPFRMKLLMESRRAGWQDILIRDTRSEFVGTLQRNDSDGHNALKRAFVRDMLSAKFALCPKGTGLSSYRLFEAMQIGRAPVVISDAWSPPPGPDWNSFLVRVPERAIARLPDILRDREHEWNDLGKKAREAWKRYYSPEQLGSTIVRQAVQVLGNTQTHRALMAAASRAYIFGPRRLTLARLNLARKFQTNEFDTGASAST